MKIALRILCCAVILFHFSVAWADTSLPDGSLTEEEYYPKGIPRVVENLKDYYKALEALQQMAKKDSNCLPRYNSEKSKAVFNSLFNESLPDEIVKKDMPLQDKRLMLTELYKAHNRLLSLYLIHQRNHQYDNEYMRIFSLNMRTQILIFELIDSEMEEYQMGPDEFFPNSEEMILAFVKEACMNIWAFDYFPEKEWKNGDDTTKSKIKQQAESYKKRVLAVKFLDFENNVRKLAPHDRPCIELK